MASDLMTTPAPFIHAIPSSDSVSIAADMHMDTEKEMGLEMASKSHPIQTSTPSQAQSQAQPQAQPQSRPQPQPEPSSDIVTDRTDHTIDIDPSTSTSTPPTESEPESVSQSDDTQQASQDDETDDNMIVAVNIIRDDSRPPHHAKMTSFPSTAAMNQHLLRLGTFTTLGTETPAVGTAAPEPMWRVYTALILTQILWVGFHLLARYSFAYINNFVFPTLRVAIALPFLFGSAYLSDRASLRSITRRDMKLLALLGLLGVTLNQNLFNLGLYLSSAGDAGLMQPASPVFTMVFAVILKREKAHWMKFAGLAAAVCGSFIIVCAETWLAPYLGSVIGGNTDQPTSTADTGSTGDTSAPADASGVDASSPHRALGMLFFMIQTLSFALYMTIQKPMLERIPPTTVTFYTFVFGGIGNLIVSAPFIGNVAWAVVPWEAWLALLYTGIVAAFLAFTFFSYATKHLPASIASLSVMLQPAIGPICGALILHEKLTVLHFVGGLFILSGLILVVHQRKRETRMNEIENRLHHAHIKQPQEQDQEQEQEQQQGISQTLMHDGEEDDDQDQEQGEHHDDSDDHHEARQSHSSSRLRHVDSLVMMPTVRRTPSPRTSWDDLPRPILKHSGSLTSDCSHKGLHVHFPDVDDQALAAERQRDDAAAMERQLERESWEERRRERDAELAARDRELDAFEQLERSLCLLDDDEQNGQPANDDNQEYEVEEVEEEVEVEVEVEVDEDEDEDSLNNTAVSNLMSRGRVPQLTFHAPKHPHSYSHSPHSHTYTLTATSTFSSSPGVTPRHPSPRPPSPTRSSGSGSGSTGVVRVIGDSSPLSLNRPLSSSSFSSSSVDPVSHDLDHVDQHIRYAYVAPTRPHTSRPLPKATYVA